MATTDPGLALTGSESVTLEVAQEFHRRMASIIEAVQAGIWARGNRRVLGHATDFGFGQQRGHQTLILKTDSRSSYLRLPWESIMGDAQPHRDAVGAAIQTAINALA